MRQLWDFFFGTSLYLTSLKRKLVKAEICLQVEEQIIKISGSFYPIPYSRALEDVKITKAEILRITKES